jgi:hypothetical protein
VRALLLLLALTLAAPLAAAQSILPAGSLTIEARPFADAVMPLRGAVATPVTVTATCDPSYLAQPPDLLVRVTRQPAWATLVVSPAISTADTSGCVSLSGQMTFRLSLLATTSDQAPAFSPDVVELTATLSSPPHEDATAKGVVPLVAGFFSILDVKSPVSEESVPPGGIAVFPVQVTNLGNANTKVLFEATTLASDLVVVPQAPLVLQSKQEGGTQTAAAVPLQVQRQADSVATGDETVTLRWSSAYVLDSRLPGDAGTLSFILHAGRAGDPLPAPQQALQSAERRVPAPASGLVALGVVGAALVARRMLR